jgi:multidrug resistance efflux pump
MKILIPSALKGTWSLFLKQELSVRIASAVFVVLLGALGVIAVLPEERVETASQVQTTISLATQTVGAESEAFSTTASWPGEIISPNDADVQPPREGAIISWGVSIGDYVNAGQVLGRLSAASLTPELATTLAEQAAALAQAKARAASTDAYVEQTKTQLNTFTTSDTALRAIEEAKQSVIATKESVRATLRQSIVSEFSEFSVNNRDVLSSTSYLSDQGIPYWFGAINSSLRNKYLTATMAALDALEKDAVPQQAGIDYFLAATQLASASIAAGESFTQADLNDLRKDIAEDQTSFNEAVAAYRDAVLDVSEKEKEYAERSRDTSQKSTELDREKITAQAELEAAEASYRAVSSAITGGSAIIAPKSGYISAIVSQIGEFVAPGKAVASISSGVKTNKIVRFRIPSNVEVPKKGDVVKIVRPGFAKDVKTATISGVGTALDGNGAFMADARIDGSIDWPAHLSVRVIPNAKTSQTIAVPFDAVYWDEVNHPHVWTVTAEGIVQSREVTTGRTFGDAVEILKGLAIGDIYLLQATESITEGMRVEQPNTTVSETAPEGDGHGHAHDE